MPDQPPGEAPTTGVVRRSQEQRAQAHPAATPLRCRHCDSPDVEITPGKYAYALHCRACHGSAPLKVRCPACGADAKLERDGARFLAHCRAGHRQLYFTNP
ncbi:hypothetical protein [Deinococcus maricopensis]|uniref:hypothetical protein n=1 Tax=Deinococcus maricopensis TaxID=309887 RepID=UPI0002F256A8|nr:hypothetical protein [Deinococcus maricopensis]